MLLGAGVVCELFSVALPGCGRLSFFFCYGILAARMDQVGGRWAALMTLLVLGGRLLQPKLGLSARLTEMLSEGLILAAAVLAATAAPPDYALPLSIGIYLGGFWWLVPALLPETSRYREARALSFPLVMALVLTTGGFSLFPAGVLWFLPIPILAGFSCGGLIEALRDKQRAGFLVAREARAAEELKSSLSQAKGESRQRLEERVLLEELAKTFAASRDLEQTLDYCIQKIGQALPADSIVFFFPDQERLHPYKWRSPRGERLESSQLLALAEPIVERCWAGARLVMSRREDLAGPRLMEEEQMACAVPLRQLGVLYVGKVDKTPYSRAHLQRLALISEPMIPAIDAGRRQLQMEALLRTLAGQKQQLALSHGQQGLMLEGFREIASTSEIARSLQALQ
ncbi:MAG: hypothetical protein KC910_36595, partial [Candidatus Eremiobacteraeota bacterium]|nr:hypothetical protein [Candidatus Eremiobacteraeota bacterium]